MTIVLDKRDCSIIIGRLQDMVDEGLEELNHTTLEDERAEIQSAIDTINALCDKISRQMTTENAE